MKTLFRLSQQLLVVFLIWGCNSQNSNVEVKTGGIWQPITYGLDGEDFSGKTINKDEWITSDGAKEMIVTVTNHSLFPYTDINLTFSSINNEATALGFKQNEQGEKTFPGLNGTCETVLLPGNTCTIVIDFTPPIDRFYEEQIRLNFKNYVEDEEHIGKIKILSGVPAQLVVVGSPSRIRIGCDDTQSLTEGGRCIRGEGLAERTLERTYYQEVTLKNVGGLSARNILIKQTERVENALGGDSCGDYCQAWKRENIKCNTGDSLAPQEECIFRFSFTPQNRPETIPSAYERIKYFHTTSIQYEKDPKKRIATSSITLESNSSKIEGRLASSQAINLLNSYGVTQGNRSTKQIRLSNEGYSNVRLKNINIKYTRCGADNIEPLSNELNASTLYDNWATCYREEGTNVLRCEDVNNGNTPHTLSTMPFKIIDESNCLLPNVSFNSDCTENPVPLSTNKRPLIPINCGCTFRVMFQPSMTTPFISPTNSCSTSATAQFPLSDYDQSGKAIRFFPVYDSRWKDGEDYCQNNPEPGCQGLPEASYLKDQFNFKVIAKRNPAARLVIQSLRYDNSLFSPTSSTTTSFNNLSEYDLGRLPVLALSQATRPSSFRTLQIVIKNEGDAFAELERITYLARGNLYSIKSDGTTEATLTDGNNCTSNQCFYRNARMTTNCTTIPSKGTCTLSINMAPFALPTDANESGEIKELKGMFDTDSSGLIFPKFKTFSFIYKNGYTYHDDETGFYQNPSGATPYTTSVRFKTILTKSAKIEEMADVEYPSSGIKNPISMTGLTKGDDFTFTSYLRNIGSAKASKIQIINNGYTFSENMNCNMTPKDCRCYNTQDPFNYFPNLWNDNICSNNPEEYLAPDEVCRIPSRWMINSSPYLQEMSDLLRRPQITQKITLDSPVASDEFTNDLERVNYNIFAPSPNKYSVATQVSYKDCYQLTNPEFNTLFPINAVSSGYDSHFGFTRTTTPFLAEINNPAVPAKLVPTLTSNTILNWPWHTAFIFRDQITGPIPLSNRVFYDNQSAKSINVDTATPYFDSIHSSNLLSAIHRSYKYEPTTLGLSPLGTDDIRYRVFMGYHHKFTLSNQNVLVFPFELKNLGGRSAKITSVTEDTSTNLYVYRLSPTNTRAGLLEANSTPLTINFGVPLKLEAQINPSLCNEPVCLFKKEYEITYETGRQTRDFNGENYFGKCNSSMIAGFCETKTIRLVVYAVINGTTSPPFDLSTKDIIVEKSSDGSMEESCLDNTFIDFTETNGTWNQTPGGITVTNPLKSLRLTNVSSVTLNSISGRAKLPYAKKIIKLTNPFSQSLRISQILLRKETNAPVIDIPKVSSTGEIGVDEFIDNSKSTCDEFFINSTNKCTQNKTLAQNESCFTLIRFRPLTSTSINYYLSYLLTLGSSGSSPNNPHFIYNLPLSFQSIDPANLTITGTGITTQSVRHKANIFVNPPSENGAVSSRTALEVPIGVAPGYLHSFSGTNTPEITREVNVTNLKTTPASFLKQFRNFKKNNTILPTANDFSADGYTQIAINYYNYLKVFATKGCFAGSELISDFSEGGFVNTNTNCKLKITIQLNHSNMLHSTSKEKDSTINPYLINLEYYSAFRSETSTLWLYAKFFTRPEQFNGAQLAWGVPVSQSGIGTELSPSITPDDSKSNYGRIVGYRILRTNLSAQSDDSEDNFPAIVNGSISNSAQILKKDFFFDSSDGVSDSGCDPRGCLIAGQDKRFYFYRLALIRSHASFTKGTELFGLANPKHFITNISNLTRLKVPIPPPGLIYNHAKKVLIDMASSPGKYTYNAAVTYCSSSFISFFNEVSTPTIQKLLINTNMYNSVSDAYSSVPLWIFNSTPTKFTDVGCLFNEGSLTEISNTCLRYDPSKTSGQKIMNLPNFTNPAYVEQALTQVGYALCYLNLTPYLP